MPLVGEEISWPFMLEASGMIGKDVLRREGMY